MKMRTPSAKRPRLGSARVWARRLAGRRIKIVGLGGVGSWASQALIPFLASLGAPCPVWLIDGDTYDSSNKSRALFESYGQKSIVKAAELSALAGGAVTVIPVPRFVTPRNVRKLIEERDIVLVFVDNHRSRQIISNAAGKLRDVLVISAGNDGVNEPSGGTFGNVIVYARADGRDLTNPLTALHPDIARPLGKGPYEMSCLELAAAGAPQLLWTNLQVAVTSLCALFAWLNGSLGYEEVFVDVLDARMTPVKRNPPVIATKPTTVGMRRSRPRRS